MNDVTPGAGPDDLDARRAAVVADLLVACVPEPPARPDLFDRVAASAARERRGVVRRRSLLAVVATGAVAAGTAGVLALGPGAVRPVPAPPAATSSTDAGEPTAAGTTRVFAGPAQTGDVPGSSADANRRIARRLADDGLASVPRPPGAVGTRWPVGPEAGSPWQVPPTAGERASRVWRVDENVADVSTWLMDHLPATVAAPMRGSYGESDGARLYGTVLPVAADLRGAVRPPYLSIAVLADGPRTTVVRVTVEVVWLVPEPLRVNATNILPVRVSTGCPGTWGDDTAPANEGADLDRALLPEAAPTGGLVCGLSLFGAAPRTTPLDATAARRFADAVRAMPLGHPLDEYAHGCPAPGVRYLVVLTYPGRPDVTLDLDPMCGGTTSNGRIEVPGLPDVDLTAWAPA